MITWISALFRLVRDYQRVSHDLPGEQPLWRVANMASYASKDLPRVEKLGKAALDLIRDRTTAHMDLSPGGRDPNTVILVGRYRSQDFVQVYSFEAKDFEALVAQMRDASRQGVVGRVDALPAFRAVIDRDFKFDGR